MMRFLHIEQSELPSFIEQVPFAPAEIERLEHACAQLHAALSDPALYRDSGERVAALKAQLSQADAALAEAFERWSALEARRDQA